MVNSAALQLAYNDLYIQFRKYLWDIPVVQDLVQLEVDTYERIPDVSSVKYDLDRLKLSILNECDLDDSFYSAFQKFYDVLDGSSQSYAKLYVVDEVISK